MCSIPTSWRLGWCRCSSAASWSTAPSSVQHTYVVMARARAHVRAHVSLKLLRPPSVLVTRIAAARSDLLANLAAPRPSGTMAGHSLWQIVWRRVLLRPPRACSAVACASSAAHAIAMARALGRRCACQSTVPSRAPATADGLLLQPHGPPRRPSSRSGRRRCPRMPRNGRSAQCFCPVVG